MPGRRKPRKGQQLSLLDEKLDAPIVKSADRYVELIKEKKAVKERIEIQERNLIGLMRKAGKDKIRHAGEIIEISMEAKEKLKMHPDRPAKKPK